MFSCIFVKNKLYDYLDSSLSEKENIQIKEHLNICSVCRERLNQMNSLINLAKNRQLPRPSEDFWHDFRIGLDRKLNSRLVSPLRLRPSLAHRLRPALAYISLSVVILVASFVLYNNTKFSLLNNNPELALVDEIDFLEEVSPEAGLTHDEDTYYIDELNLLYQLNEQPT